jgi:uracil-DNA glycosylase
MLTSPSPDIATDIPENIRRAVDRADPSWQPILLAGLQAVADADPGYLAGLAKDSYLPTGDRLFAAFRQPLGSVRYVLFGEGPYPREESATGVCFMDGAVHSLWSVKGLSKPVNRATSLRNFMKMLLVIDGRLLPEQTSGDALLSVAVDAMREDSDLIQTREELEDKLLSQGFLLLNAALVFRHTVPPLKDAKAWQPLMNEVLRALASHAQVQRQPLPTLVLWGKTAAYINSLPSAADFPKLVSEHPYNLTFIANPVMQALFKPMHLLRREANPLS